ncbi:putative OsmC-like protein [Sinobaca qinghaiensis]|uniref:Putative OsmC-like protein n=1 Tax=Sinobaca qinghaiensis TaxID=342944 RepID=A0A419UZH1_9BACL|nr:OsmC family protein [Sinobaca qinghaiensis]RKD71068.1 putative OsmC-like protein [Sinobaca qinghaiensis]
MYVNFSMTEHGFITETNYGTLHISSDEEHGFRPYQLMTASLAVCSGGVLKKIMKKQRMDVQDIEIRTNVERSGTEADEITKVSIHFVIDSHDKNDKKMLKNMELTRKYCSMVQSVKDSIQVEETYEWK